MKAKDLLLLPVFVTTSALLAYGLGFFDLPAERGMAMILASSLPTVLWYLKSEV